MTEQHPITPPPQLRQLWAQQAQRMDPHDPVAWQEHVAIKAARWGADQELEACCKALEDIWDNDDVVTQGDFLQAFRVARRPKAPSLAEQALTLLDDASTRLDAAHENTIRRALERLQELEGEQ